MTQSPIQQQTIQLVATQIPKTEKLEEMLTPFALDETLIRHLTKEEDGPVRSLLDARRYRDSWDDRYKSALSRTRT